MKKTLRVTLELEVSDISDADRKEAAGYAECSVSDLPSLEDHSPNDVAEVLDGLAVEGLTEEFFAGMELYVQFDAVKIKQAEWV